MKVSSSLVTGIVANIAATVLLVLTNKYLYAGFGFEFMVFLSFLHFVTTTIATRAFIVVGMVEYKPMAWREVLPVAAAALASVAFMNLSLGNNSVGFYQVSKMMTIPVTLVLQYMWTGDTVSRRVLAALASLLAGVYLATVAEVGLNARGFMYAVVAVLSTAVCQILTKQRQRALGVSSNQLLYHTSPLIATGMLAITPIFDDVRRDAPGSLLAFEWSAGATLTVLFTCAAAVAVNVTNYLIIGKTSPVTYQVVGHLKTMLVIVLGVYWFDVGGGGGGGSALGARKLLGIALAFFSVVVYTEVKRHEAEGGKATLASVVGGASALHDSERQPLVTSHKVED